MAAQVYNSLYTNEEIAAMIAASNPDVYVKVFELLPEFLKAQDSEKVIQGFLEAAQQEYDRIKESVTEVLTIVDPKKVNKGYSLEGNFTFFHPEQFAIGFDSTPTYVVINSLTTAAPPSGFYNNFGLFVWSDSTNPNAVGQYRKILSYDGSTKRAYIDESWDYIPSVGAVFALCWPDRVWLPTAIVSNPKAPAGTLLPPQSQQADATYINETYGLTVEPSKIIRLPGLPYLASIHDYYVGWSIEFMDGSYKGSVSTIVDYIGGVDRLLIINDSISPSENDWFKLIPPNTNFVSTADNAYKNKWIQVGQLVNNEVVYGTKIPSQARQIVASVYDPLSTPASHIAYVYDPISNNGKEFDYPPTPVSYFGIRNSYIPLTYLATYLGMELDEEDSEDFQREQIAQAYNLHKIRGTRKAMELICKSFGFDVIIDEATSNYVPEDGKIITPELGVAQIQYPGTEVDPLVLQGKGFNDIPEEYLTLPGMLEARIPDSDIRVYLERVNPQALTFNKVVKRVAKKLENVIPAHVQIVFIGLLTKIPEKVKVTPALTINPTIYSAESVEVSDSFLGTYLGEVPIDDSVEVIVPEYLAIRTDARYSTSRARIGQPTFINALTRWSEGLVMTV